MTFLYRFAAFPLLLQVLDAHFVHVPLGPVLAAGTAVDDDIKDGWDAQQQEDQHSG